MRAILAATLAFIAVPAYTNPAADPHAAEVKTTFMAGISAFNAHDLPRFMRQFDPELQMFTPTGWLRGGHAVRARFADTFARFPAVRMEIEDLQARTVAPDVVTVGFRWRTYPQGSGGAFHGVGSGVYVRKADGWREVLEHETVTRTDPEFARQPLPQTRE